MADATYKWKPKNCSIIILPKDNKIICKTSNLVLVNQLFRNEKYRKKKYKFLKRISLKVTPR